MKKKRKRRKKLVAQKKKFNFCDKHLDVPNNIYKNKKIPDMGELIKEIEKDIGKKLTPSILYKISKKDTFYGLHLFKYLSKMKCMRNFIFEKKKCENIVKEFNQYNKLSLNKAYKKYMNIDDHEHECVNGIGFFLLCGQTNFKILGNHFMHSVEEMICDIDAIYEFIDCKNLIEFFFCKLNNLKSINFSSTIKSMHFFFEKIKNQNYINQLRKKSVCFDVFVDLYLEYYSNVKDTNYLTKKSNEYLKEYFRCLTNLESYYADWDYEKNKKGFDLWRYKILKKIVEDEFILDLFMNNIIFNDDHKKIYDNIFRLIENNINLLYVFSKYRHHLNFSIKIENRKKMYLKLINHKSFKFKYSDCEKMNYFIFSGEGCPFNSNFFSTCAKKKPSIITSIYKYKNSIEDKSRYVKKIIINNHLFLVLLRLKSSIVEINLLKPILSFL